MTAFRAFLAALVLIVPLSAREQAAAPVVGWRGDGSGRYPAATPPLTWNRVSSAIAGLRHQASKPGAADRGMPLADGVIREWLVLRPAPVGVRVDQELSPDEAQLTPAEGDKLGDGVWTKAATDTSWIDFRRILGRDVKGIGVAATNVWSESGGKFRVLVTQLGNFRMVLNGKLLPPGYGRYSIDLAKGWNRVILKVAQREADWACTFALHAPAPAVYTESNIAWRVPLPGVHGGFYGGGTGCSAPLIVGDRIYLLSEPHDLICLNKADGRVLWIRTNSYYDAASADQRKGAEDLAAKLDAINAALPAGPLNAKQLEEKAKLEAALYARMKEVDPVRYKRSEYAPDVGFSGMTPVSDGRRIYLWIATGVTACYDLEGKRQWIRVDNLPAAEHGFSSSPLLVDGKFVVFMRDVLAFNAATGELAWSIPLISHEGFNPGGYFHGSATRADVGGVPLVVLGNGTIVRASDGKILATHPEMANQAISSPVVDRGLLFETTTGSMKFFIGTLPAGAAEPFKVSTRTVSVATTDFPHYYMPWHMASPLIHEGLAYLLNNNGVLTVVDIAEGKVLYQKMLDIDGFQTANEGAARGCGISPTLAGKYIYLLGNNGGSVVIEPGRVYKQVAKNKLEGLVMVGHWAERQERYVANPVFEGDRLYLRGEGHLYAISSKAGPAQTTRAEGPVAAPTPATVAKTAPPPDLKDPEETPSPYSGWRRNGSGVFPAATPPQEWSEKQNVPWRATVGKGLSSPIVAGDRVVVVSEPGDLICLSRKDGSPLWKVALGEASPKELARATPASDGTSIYLSLGNGTVASYTLDGKRRWVEKVEPAALPYGPSASPVLIGETLLVDGKRLQGLDAATGKPRWSASVESFYGTPAIVTLGGAAYAVTAKGAVVRVSDGAVLATGIAEGLGGDQSPSPLVRGDVVYFAYKRCSAVKLALKEGKVVPEKLWEQELPGDVISSPLLAGGILFVATAGPLELLALNARSGELLFEKELDLASNLYPSLAMAGGRLYLGNDEGEMLVLEPGRVYKELRHNRLPAGSGASPTFTGSQLFLRGGEFLYCVGR